MPRTRWPIAIAIALVVVSLALGASTVPGSGATAPAAKPTIAGVFPLDGEPGPLTLGPDGAMWVTLSGNSGGNDLARATRNGTITYHDVPGVSGLGWITTGPDDDLWATISTGVVRIPPEDPSAAVDFAINGFTDAQGIDTGPDDNLWAASGDTLFRVPPADPAAATGFAVPGMAARQVSASGTRIWVADFLGGRVHSFGVNGNSVPHDVGGNPQGIAAGRKGQVFYSNPENGAHHVARITINGTPQKTPLPDTDPSFGVTYAADGAYWVGLFLTRKMARVTPDGKLSTGFGTFPAPYLPRYVEAGPGGTVWASLQDPGSDGALGRVRGLAADTRVTVRLASTTVKVRRGKAALRLTCPKSEASGPCAGKVVLRSRTGKKRELGSKGFSVRPGRTTAVRVGLDAATIRSIGRDGRRVLAVIRVRDRAGNSATVRKVVRLVRVR